MYVRIGKLSFLSGLLTQNRNALSGNLFQAFLIELNLYSNFCAKFLLETYNWSGQRIHVTCSQSQTLQAAQHLVRLVVSLISQKSVVFGLSFFLARMFCSSPTISGVPVKFNRSISGVLQQHPVTAIIALRCILLSALTQYSNSFSSLMPNYRENKELNLKII